jgi:hypothetical protein
MFPAKIRYIHVITIPCRKRYFGLLPAISTYLVINEDAGDPEFYLEGLWYPIIIASMFCCRNGLH